MSSRARGRRMEAWLLEVPPIAVAGVVAKLDGIGGVPGWLVSTGTLGVCYFVWVPIWGRIVSRNS